MTRTVFAIAAAAVIFAAVFGTSQAAPIAPLAGVSAADTGQLTPIYWHHHHHRHCWRGPYGHLHCRW